MDPYERDPAEIIDDLRKEEKEVMRCGCDQTDRHAYE